MKTKQLLLTFLFLLLVLFTKAQVKYQYAVIDFFPRVKTLEVSINGIEYKNIKVEKEDVKGDCDVNVALKEVNLMAKDGWELFNTNAVAGSTSGIKAYIFYLRKVDTGK